MRCNNHGHHVLTQRNASRRTGGEIAQSEKHHDIKVINTIRRRRNASDMGARCGQRLRNEQKRPGPGSVLNTGKLKLTKSESDADSSGLAGPKFSIASSRRIVFAPVSYHQIPSFIRKQLWKFHCIFAT